MEGEFNVILNKDEKIIESFKPKKAKMYFTSIFGACIIALFVAAVACLAHFIPDYDTGDVMPLSVFVVMIVAAVAIVIVAAVLVAVAYNKRLYCITNQRVIIRCGIIGVDFRSLELKSIGAVDVNVGLFDKILRMNTGTIRFGSMSAPINGNVVYAFAHVVDPYGVYKRLKEIIESV